LPDWPNDLEIFLAQRKHLEFDKWSQSIESDQTDNQWKIEILNPSGGIYATVPWYQIIQEPSNIGDGTGTYDGNSFATYNNDHQNDAGATDSYGCSKNIQGNFDGSNWKFTNFALGLNYMFTDDNIASDSDNVIAYNSDLLQDINDMFVPHPDTP
jgi:hypothetical protein